MRHPDKVWSDPAYAQESLVDRLREYEHHLRGRAQRVSEATIVNYRNALRSFLCSLEHNGDPAVLGAITPHAVCGSATS